MPERLIGSSQNDASPEYSPDGRQIAFSSNRGGTTNIWVADADGANLRQLTSFATHSGSPHWSPDSRQIAFDSRESGNPDVYLVDAAGGVPRRLTDDPSEDVVPTFSRDGRSVYFTSNRSGRAEVWRMPVAGGAARQVTRDGGLFGVESWDGQTLYFVGLGRPVLWRVPVAGGAATHALKDLQQANWWAVARDGIYYATMRELVLLRSNETTIHYLDLRSGRVTDVFTQRGPVWPSYLTVSPDEQWIVRHQHSMPQSELMLVENFR